MRALPETVACTLLGFLRTMFGRRYAIARAFGIDIRADLGCAAVSLLILWTLATGLFPERYIGLSGPVHWLMGIAGTIGLFASIVLHELGHALVARRTGIGVDGITLFVFGGVAEMSDEPATPDAELAMAAAGPLVSIVLGALFFALSAADGLIHWPRSVLGLIEYLSAMNVILAVFNLIPAFPLDGGRILRAALWRRTKSLTAATRIAARTGAVFGYMFIAAGIVEIARGQLIAGLWWVLIGAFVRVASETSYNQLLLRLRCHAPRGAECHGGCA